MIEWKDNGGDFSTAALDDYVLTVVLVNSPISYHYNVKYSLLRAGDNTTVESGKMYVPHIDNPLDKGKEQAEMMLEIQRMLTE